MTDSIDARRTGVLSRIAAAGHTTRQVEFETPDGEPMTLTVIDADRRRASGRKRADQRSTEPDQDEQIVEGADSAERPTKWA